MTARMGPDGARHTFGYDTELRLIEVTNSQGLRWNYVHDAVGQLVSESDFDGRVVDAYDRAGRLASSVNAVGQMTRFEPEHPRSRRQEGGP
ncbi:hypothetical protein STENM36S_09590 [Streptomyces tendae]